VIVVVKQATTISSKSTKSPFSFDTMRTVASFNPFVTAAAVIRGTAGIGDNFSSRERVNITDVASNLAEGRSNSLPVCVGRCACQCVV